MTEIDLLRNLGKKTLSKKLGKNSEKYEIIIFNMCVRLKKKNNLTTLDAYKRYGVEKIGCIMNCKDKQEIAKVLNDIKTDKVDWESSNYDYIREKEKIAYEKSQIKPKVISGVYKCRNKNCGSDECWSFSMQTRSADEGATNFIVCSICGTRFKIN